MTTMNNARRGAYYVGEDNVGDGWTITEWAAVIRAPLNDLGIEVIEAPQMSGRGLVIYDPAPYTEDTLENMVKHILDHAGEEVEA